MNYKFTSKYGRHLEIDLTKWIIDKESRSCKIIEISENFMLLENIYKDRFSIPENVIKANELKVVDNTIDLSEGLYENYFLKKFRSESQRKSDESFEEYASLIFQNRTLVLNRAEYYLLKPSILSTGFMYSGGINFNLGILFESFESGNHVYYDEFCGYRKMFLVSMAASPLSGSIFKVIFWSDEKNEFVRFDSNSNFPNNFDKSAGLALYNSVSSNDITIDRQDEAIEKLIQEIKY
jgi:hypothetical protein